MIDKNLWIIQRRRNTDEWQHCIRWRHRINITTNICCVYRVVCFCRDVSLLLLLGRNVNVYEQIIINQNQHIIDWKSSMFCLWVEVTSIVYLSWWLQQERNMQMNNKQDSDYVSLQKHLRRTHTHTPYPRWQLIMDCWAIELIRFVCAGCRTLKPLPVYVV